MPLLVSLWTVKLKQWIARCRAVELMGTAELMVCWFVTPSYPFHITCSHLTHSLHNVLTSAALNAPGIQYQMLSYIYHVLGFSYIGKNGHCTDTEHSVKLNETPISFPHSKKCVLSSVGRLPVILSLRLSLGLSLCFMWPATPTWGSNNTGLCLKC